MIAITGASGQLGRLVVERLAQKVDPSTIVATARTPEKLADLAETGIVIRELDYDRPETIAAALEGVNQVLLISSSDVGRRVAQHKAVIDAADAAGVEHIAYTSILKAGTSPLIAAIEHKATEELLASAAATTTILRHGWYIENYTSTLAPSLEHGAIVGAAQEGRVAAAARADYAAADVAALTDPSLRGQTLELAGNPFTMAEYAAIVSAAAGREVPYVDMPKEQYMGVLSGAGLPEPLAEFLADADVGISQGHLDGDSSLLQKLAGTLTPVEDLVQKAVADLS